MAIAQMVCRTQQLQRRLGSHCNHRLRLGNNLHRAIARFGHQHIAILQHCAARQLQIYRLSL